MSGPVAPLVFVHVPKAAGTSLKDLIARVYAGRPALFFTPADGRLERFAALPAASRASCAVVAGHEPFGLQRVYEGSGVCPSVITVLRAPVARVCSLYRYIFAEPGHASHASFVAERPSVGDVLSARTFVPFDNHQTRYLAGRASHDKPFGGLDAADLALAQENLERGCVAFGLQHRMEDSLALFGRVLKWPAITTPALNVGKAESNAPEISASDRAAIEAANSLDMELFSFASRLFDQRLRDAGLASLCSDASEATGAGGARRTRHEGTA